jgi:HlyD family secretion protein
MAKLKTIKTILKTAAILACAGLLIFAFIPERIKADMAEVTRGDLLITLEGEGKTRIHDIYVVSTPIDGRITRIQAEPGDIVVAGETIIANMYPANPKFLDKRSETQAKADVEGARAALSLANSRVKQASARLAYDLSDYKRTQILFSQKNVSTARLERADLRLKTQEAELNTAKANQKVMLARLNAAKARLLQPSQDNGNAQDHCQICLHSPVDGRVLRILHKSESTVPAGTPLVEIGDPADLEVKIEMLSTNAVRVKVGDDALIKRWGGTDDIRARVVVIEPSGYTKISALGVEEQRVNVILKFTDPAEKWRSLGDAFRVEAAIITHRAENTLKVPLSALFRHNEIWSVFQVIEGTATLKSVKVGYKNDRYAEITKGLSEKDQIIIHPGNNISDGSSIEKR